jgi:mannose-1-phosphate guanylyltransferase
VNGGDRRPLPAIVLVGGEGTRLRPLTEKVPKAMLPVLGRPLLEYTLDRLRATGVERAVLAGGSSLEPIRAHFGDAVEGLPLEYRAEPSALGTGGAIRFAGAEIERTFLALNGDSITSADLRPLVDFHASREAKATLLLARVDDPSEFGRVEVDDRGRVEAFVEKPPRHEVAPGLVNAGVYVIEPEVLELIPSGRAVSIETEVFPKLSSEGVLYSLELPGYWLDVGTLPRYLQAHIDLLNDQGGSKVDPSAKVSSDAELRAPVEIGAGARIEGGASVGPHAYLGAGAEIGAGATVSSSVVLPGATVAPGAQVARAIIAPEIGSIPT